jgi:hypothetical protein
MRIESIIQRSNGTHVTLGGVSYHFRPRKKGGAHTCIVNDKQHIQRFLSITEGYRIASSDKQPVSKHPDLPLSPGDGLPDVGVAGVVTPDFSQGVDDTADVVVERDLDRLTRVELAREYRAITKQSVPKKWDRERLMREIDLVQIRPGGSAEAVKHEHTGI